MTYMRAVWIGWGLLLAVAATAAAAELPVRHVTLYKHGIGFFERAGTLAPGETARLEFRASDMNDVLKSLTIEDKSGAKITGLRYDADEPLARKLQRFPFGLENGQSLAALLDSLRGARIEIQFGPEKLEGAIVSARVAPASQGVPEQQQLTLFTNTGELRNINLAAAASLRFVDPELQAQFRDYLATLSKSRSMDKRTVSIASTDAGARELVASYVIPTPVWKSSYRLILRPGAGASILEGWAIVDNTTEDDWNNVRLAVVSGRPISFVSLLYPTREVSRPVVALTEETPEMPVEHEGVLVGAAPKEMAVAGAAPPPPPPVKMEVPRMRSSAAMPMEIARDAMESSVSTAGARELGELFEYSFTTPVTVRKGESAMLPFLQQKLPVRKLLILSEEGAVHPRNAVEITNSSGKTLDGGPITVYDEGAYAGEALVSTLKNGDKRLISYAVDLGTNVSTQFGSGSDAVREVRLRNGVLITQSAYRHTRTYTVRNVDAKPKTLIIEHPVRPGMQVVSPKPAETTPSNYRFEVALGPSATATLPVVEEGMREQTVMVASVSPELLLTYLRNPNLSAGARQTLERIAKQKQAIVQLDREINERNNEMAELARDQERIRQNLASLNAVAGQQDQVQTYARTLANQEARVVQLRETIAALRKKRAEAQTQLEEMISSASF
jgi:hypothetical protein